MSEDAELLLKNVIDSINRGSSSYYIDIGGTRKLESGRTVYYLIIHNSDASGKTRKTYANRSTCHLFNDIFVFHNFVGVNYCIMSISELLNLCICPTGVRQFYTNEEMITNQDVEYLRQKLNVKHCESRIWVARLYTCIDEIMYKYTITRPFYILTAMLVNEILIRKDDGPLKICRTNRQYTDVTFVCTE